MEKTDQEKDKLAQQYDLLAHKFNELYFAGKARGRESMSAALEKAHQQLTEVKEFSKEQGIELKKYLARDLDQTISYAQQLGDKAKDQLNPSRLGAGALSSLATVLEFTGNTFQSLSDKTRQTITYKTGEITSAGTLTCQKCEKEIHLTHTGHIPPCPKCRGTSFTKGY